MPDGTKWVSVNVEPKVRARAERLAALLTKEKGVNVARSDAVRIAIDEAIERREGKRGGS